ncbi:DsbA family protein [Crenothrix polyspora]|uniref:Putative Thiol:disulfide interchange protein DsbA n=1 Tax=Crenothrix polyspora TaxID=360316 RepID=A0A1R4H971_9GAMM|nr:thioredoxin domain-containing protein [Crenothrix polyspora]SJM92814.1 putative Thiol:disulfide interchange protein DsbA [Crenothrix polyspora]
MYINFIGLVKCNIKINMRRIIAVFTAAFLFQVTPSFARSDKMLENEIAALKEGQKAIQKDLQEIKNILRSQPQGNGKPHVPQNIVLSVEGGELQGNKNTKLTLIEYTDFQCPFCGKYVHDTYPIIKQDFINTGKLKYVRKDFPLESIHPYAFKAAEASHCAQEQTKGAEMHKHLFDNQGQLSPANLLEYAKVLALDVDDFQKCMDSGKYALQIRKNITEAQSAGVTGTPSFFLGTSDISGKIKVVRSFTGAQPFSSFKAAIDEVLNNR